MENKKMFVGLDIGTDSVGYAVTDEKYNVLKFKGEPAWGVTLFNEASLCDGRRGFRTARRRLNRRQHRVELVREIFAEEIYKVDPKFYIRQDASRLNREDTEERYTLFDDENYTDKDYNKFYPTIHHLIFDLMNSEEPHDVRLVYLACAWLVAHRGHFLSEVSKDNISGLTDFTSVWNDMTNWFTEIGFPIPFNEEDVIIFEEKLKKRISVTAKFKEISGTLSVNLKQVKEENSSYNAELIVKALCGSKVSVKDLFGNESYAELGSFSLGDDDEALAEIYSNLEDDDAETVRKMKAVCDWALLVDVLEGSKCISQAKIKIYDTHKNDLSVLKKTIRKYCTKEIYNDVFKNENSGNYVAYTSSVEKGKCTYEVFGQYIKKILEKIQPKNDEDAKEIQEIFNRISLGTYMPKQKNTNNRIIPYQLYWYELKELLGKAEKYLPFLAEKDKDGYSATEKLLEVFTFRVPYYVGPLNDYKSNYAWLVRKSEGKICPWNFDTIVDKDKSETEFIRRMINKCTYLPDAEVLPKESLMYHRFSVLNEINNIKVNGEPISVEIKQRIYNELYMTERKVTHKKLETFFKKINCSGVISGIDEDLHADLKSYHDFKRLLEKRELSEQQVEDIIRQRTYCEDKILFKNWLNKKYGFLNEEDRNYIASLKYKDFGRLSKEFLNVIEGTYKGESSTGELFTILSAMWNTNKNLMELLSDDYTFKSTVETREKEYYSTNVMSLDDRLDSMYISNAVKRPIIRSLEIVKEITKAFGKEPDKIFIEMTRGGKPENKGKRTKSRKQQLLELYQQCKDEDVRELKKQLEEMGPLADNRLQGDRLFLYYMQLGKCMYSEEPLDINLIAGDTYNIEHIYPRAFVKDDSILNNEVLVKSELNGQKSDEYPISEAIRKKMATFWKSLRDKKLITEEKYMRLTRNHPFSEDEKWQFINRQLTETSQSTKAVAELLKERYKNSEIVYVKAGLTSEFRQFLKVKKSRVFNDLHHAKDAYLNIITGNVYNSKFTKQWFYANSERYSIKTETLFGKQVKIGDDIIWSGAESIEKTKKLLAKNNIHMTTYAFCKQGQFFAQMPVKKASGLVPLKKGLDTEKYGGYNGTSVSFFLITKYTIGKKTDIMVMPVELLFAKDVLCDENSAKDYAKRRIEAISGKKVDSVSFPLGLRKIKINTILSLDGLRVCLSGTSSKGKCLIAQTFTAFSAPERINDYIKNIENLVGKVQQNKNYVFDSEFDNITYKENIALYDLYIEKLSNSIYEKRINNPVETLKTGRELFLRLNEIEQARVLLNIHAVFGVYAGGNDLTKIGGVEKAAATSSFSAIISNWKKNYSDIRIIDQSVTGLWEKSSCNLLDLL